MKSYCLSKNKILQPKCSLMSRIRFVVSWIQKFIAYQTTKKCMPKVIDILYDHEYLFIYFQPGVVGLIDFHRRPVLHMGLNF